MWGIALAVAAWGVYHAIGAYRYNHNPWRAVMVLACVGGFLGFWGLLLRSARFRELRNRRDRMTDTEQE